MIRALVASVVGALLLACVVAPVLHLSGRALVPTGDWPYSRVFDRTAMAALLVLLIALRRSLELPRLLASFRLGSRRQRLTAFALGLVLSAATGLAVLPLLVRGGVMAWSGIRAGDLALKLLVALAAAAVVSVIEEGFFRLLVFGGLRRRMPVFAAAVASSLFYAAIHFLAPARDFEVSSWSLAVGFEYFGRILSRFALPSVHAGMVGLFLVGLVLCAALHRGRSIALCVGLHAGWFLAAKAAVLATNPGPAVQLPRGVDERYFMIGQPLTWLSIAAVGAAIWIVLGQRARSEAP